MFLTADLPDAYWVLRKAAVLISFAGGLREAELRSLDLANFDLKETAYFITFNAAKQC